MNLFMILEDHQNLVNVIPPKAFDSVVINGYNPKSQLLLWFMAMIIGATTTTISATASLGLGFSNTI